MPVKFLFIHIIVSCYDFLGCVYFQTPTLKENICFNLHIHIEQEVIILEDVKLRKQGFSYQKLMRD